MTALMTTREFNGLKVHPLSYGSTVNASITLEDHRKVTISGKACLQTHAGSYENQPEIIYNVWSPTIPPDVKYAPSVDYRLEAPMPIDDFYRMVFQSMGSAMEQNLIPDESLRNIYYMLCESKGKIEKHLRSK